MNNYIKAYGNKSITKCTNLIAIWMMFGCLWRTCNLDNLNLIGGDYTYFSNQNHLLVPYMGRLKEDTLISGILWTIIVEIKVIT